VTSDQQDLDVGLPRAWHRAAHETSGW